MESPPLSLSLFAVPPSISLVNTGKNLSVKKDFTVTLACNATGFPQPKIVWQREVRTRRERWLFSLY